MLACRAMRILPIVSLRALPAAGPVFARPLVGRGAVGAFFAAIPAAARAPVTDHVAPCERRRLGLAWRGQWRWTGRGPALVAPPAWHGLGLPLCVTDALPLPAIGILWRLLPRNERISGAASAALGLNDARLCRPMIVAFAAMFSVAIGQITVGVFAIDRLQLEPEQPPGPHGFAGCRAQASTQSARRSLGRFANAPRALPAHRSPAGGAGDSPFALFGQTAPFIFGAKPRQGAKKIRLLSGFFFLANRRAPQAGPPDRSLPEAGRLAPPRGGYFKTAMKLSAMRSTLRLFKPATHMRPLLTM